MVTREQPKEEDKQFNLQDCRRKYFNVSESGYTTRRLNPPVIHYIGHERAKNIKMYQITEKGYEIGNTIINVAETTTATIRILFKRSDGL